MNITPDRIERSLVMSAPIERVFAAISDPAEFGVWFSSGVEGDFEVGSQPVINAGKYGKYRLAIVGKEAPSYFAYRWVSGTAFMPDGFVDNPLEHPHTLVEFHLSEVADGTEVRVVETGFASLPESYAAQNFEDNTGGWEYQLNALREYLAQ